MRLHFDRPDSRRRAARRSVRGVQVVACACAVAGMLALAGCGTAPNPPIAFVQNYLNALGGGDFATACGMVDGQAFAALSRAKHVRTSCPVLFRRCLPRSALALKNDQTQLLYANIVVTLSDKGQVANADTSATAVATELKHVTLKHEDGVWKFTRFGRAFEACRAHPHKPRHKPRHHAPHKSSSPA